MRKLSRSISLVWALSLAAGCGYSTDSLYRQDIRTVSVSIFESKEFRRGLEYEFTKELDNMIQLRTPYKLTSRDRADTEIKGTIRDLSESVVAEDSRDTSTAVQVRLSVEYEWKDLRTGKALCGGERHYSWYYAPSEGQTLRSAQTTAMRKLAEMIVEDMEKEW